MVGRPLTRHVHEAGGVVRAAAGEGGFRFGIIGQSAPMQEVFKTIGQLAASDATALITGESGTGKELVARAIYSHSQRSSQSYLAINCVASRRTAGERVVRP